MAGWANCTDPGELDSLRSANPVSAEEILLALVCIAGGCGMARYGQGLARLDWANQRRLSRERLTPEQEAAAARWFGVMRALLALLGVMALLFRIPVRG